MTNEERISNLKKLGYTDREAEFLCLAALHSGYFLRRQFLFFIGKGRGQMDANFIDKTTTNKHAKPSAFRGDRVLHHIASKLVYEALGEADNRNRRQHEVFTIKNRLMSLDFVLQNRSHRFLATEREKTSFFCHELKLTEKHLPVKRYRSPENGTTTDRHFVDKLPIFTETGASSSTVLPHFCYIDEGQHSTSRFEQHLQEYRGLFAQLNRFRLLYVSCFPDQFEPSRRLFERMILNRTNIPVDPLATRLIAYFQDRNAYETKDLKRFNQQKLIQFREDRYAFSGRDHEVLFEQWKRTGDSAVITHVCPDTMPKCASAGEFGTYLLKFNYELFGTLLNGKPKAKACTE